MDSNGAPADCISVAAAKPFPFTAPRGRLGLLNIDWQRDFLEPGGFGDSLGNNIALLQAALGPTVALLKAARAAGMPVFHTLEAHKPDLSNLPPSKKRRCSAIGEVLDQSRGRVLIEGEPGNAIVEAVAPIPGEIIINKPGKGAFWNTDFEDELRRLGVTHLLVTGVTTEVCVQTTIREANDRGYECLLVTDATESYFPEFKAATLQMIVAQGGIAGWTASTAEVIPAIEAAGGMAPVEWEADGSGDGTMQLDANGEQCVDRSGAGSVAVKSSSGPLERPAPLESVPAAARAAADRLLSSPLVAEANASARRVIAGVQPMLKAVLPAREVVGAFAGGAKIILHAGPPVASFQDMCGPMQGAIIGAVLLEGWAEDAEAAARLAASGALTLQPCHQHSAVGPMAGILCPSMPVLVTVDASGSTAGAAYCSLNEGLGKVLRFGAHSPEVLARLRWMCDELGPALNAALARLGGLQLRGLMGMALQMGDDGHNRCKALTALLLQALSPALMDCAAASESAATAASKAATFLSKNAHFGLNVAMGMCKLSLDSISGIPHCTYATAMARNGLELGVTVAGDPGTWHVAPSPAVTSAVWFSGYNPSDASRDLGDSAITETLGLGAPATAAAPALMAFVGGSAAQALQYTAEARHIYGPPGVWPELQVPALDFAAIPMMLDVALVVAKRMRPAINTGIAHKEAGVGQIGTGVSRAPLAAFAHACEALAAKLE